jgi:hypothetical protein
VRCDVSVTELETRSNASSAKRDEFTGRDPADTD